MLNRSYLLASQLMSMFTVSIMLFLNNEKLLVSSFFFFLVTTSIGATINVHFAGMYYLVNSPIISNNTDYHLKKNCKLHTDIFIIILIITQRTKKVVSDSPGLVDFAIGLVNSVFNLPDGQVMFFEEFE